jgi:iron complex transport system permease protein
VTALTSRPPLVQGDPSDGTPDGAAAPGKAGSPPDGGRRRGRVLLFSALVVLLLVTVVAGIVLGSVRLPLRELWNAATGADVTAPYDVILSEVRVPRTITAVLVGAGMSVSGLQLQTLFRNPLAEPYLLGITSGAGLGVALVVLVAGSSPWAASMTAGIGLRGEIGTTAAAAIGAGAVMAVVLVTGRLVGSTTLLLLGVMIGYLVSAVVTVLLSKAAPELVQQYVRWGFGSFHGVTWPGLRVLVPVTLAGLAGAMLLGKWLNALLLGERYAHTMGVPIAGARIGVVTITSVLAGVSTAFCGPVQFLGLAVPHLARAVFRTSDHRVLTPACVLLGAALALTADILAQLPGEGVLPLNAVNAAFGAPVVIYVLLRRTAREVAA